MAIPPKQLTSTRSRRRGSTPSVPSAAGSERDGGQRTDVGSGHEIIDPALRLVQLRAPARPCDALEAQLARRVREECDVDAGAAQRVDVGRDGRSEDVAERVRGGVALCGQVSSAGVELPRTVRAPEAAPAGGRCAVSTARARSRLTRRDEQAKWGDRQRERPPGRLERERCAGGRALRQTRHDHGAGRERAEPKSLAFDRSMSLCAPGPPPAHDRSQSVLRRWC